MNLNRFLAFSLRGRCRYGGTVSVCESPFFPAHRLSWSKTKLDTTRSAVGLPRQARDLTVASSGGSISAHRLDALFSRRNRADGPFFTREDFSAEPV